MGQLVNMKKNFDTLRLQNLLSNNPVFPPLSKQNQCAELLLTPSSISAKKFICFGLSSASKTSAFLSGDLASLICFLAARLRNKAVLASCSYKNAKKMPRLNFDFKKRSVINENE